MKVLNRLKQFVSNQLNRLKGDDGAEPALVGARLKRPKPAPGASSIALAEPD
jgi:hypothetical protein